ncbi:thiamine biosynthesis protein ThiF [Anatilimnocola aggregata]|uniref:Thiamine biosynthesis protein ThiF n=2 Tax=Anatilimnocola aggregata TaxID=2528021 RepID=A0A517Y7Q1_9BACT|nr:thiamine biosynthesis protein ThiF [Anatilimnocola aggregata]
MQLKERRPLTESVTLIGVGAVGRQMAILLTAQGIRKLQLIDGQVVQRRHICTQGFLADDVGRPKVHAVADLCQQIDPHLDVSEEFGRFRSGMPLHGIVFCCASKDSVRTRIRRSVKAEHPFWGEAVIQGEVIRVATATSSHRSNFASTAAAEVNLPAGKELKSKLPLATMAAALLVRQFIRFAEGLPNEGDIVIDLVAGKYLRGPTNG